MATDRSRQAWISTNHPGKTAGVGSGRCWAGCGANLFSGIGNSIPPHDRHADRPISSSPAWHVGPSNAFWEPIWVNRRCFAVGLYPAEQMWQPAAVLLMVSLLFGLSAGRWEHIMRNLGIGLGRFTGAAGGHSDRAARRWS